MLWNALELQSVIDHRHVDFSTPEYVARCTLFTGGVRQRQARLAGISSTFSTGRHRHDATCSMASYMVFRLAVEGFVEYNFNAIFDLQYIFFFLSNFRDENIIRCSQNNNVMCVSFCGRFCFQNNWLVKG